MSLRWSAFIGIVGITAIAILLIGLSSCARDQQLSSLTIQPATGGIRGTNIPVNLDAGLNVQLRAIGSYVHPPESKDLTNQVTWSSNTTDMVTVDSAGVLTATGTGCGNALVSATLNTSKSNIATAYMTATVVCFTGTGPTGPTLVVNIGGGTGIVISSPAGIGCSASCGSVFPSGTMVTLTATPNGASTSATWGGGCDTINGNVCTVSSLTADRIVNVTFN